METLEQLRSELRLRGLSPLTVRNYGFFVEKFLIFMKTMCGHEGFNLNVFTQITQFLVSDTLPNNKSYLKYESLSIFEIITTIICEYNFLSKNELLSFNIDCD